MGHLLLLDAYPELLRSETVPEAFFTVGVFMLLVAAVCTLWRAVLPRGPLEAFLAAPWEIIEGLVQLVARWFASGRSARRPNHGQ